MASFLLLRTEPDARTEITTATGTPAFQPHVLIVNGAHYTGAPSLSRNGSWVWRSVGGGSAVHAVRSVVDGGWMVIASFGRTFRIRIRAATFGGAMAPALNALADHIIPF